jgi:hypothetical protein
MKQSIQHMHDLFTSVTSIPLARFQDHEVPKNATYDLMRSRLQGGSRGMMPIHLFMIQLYNHMLLRYRVRPPDLGYPLTLFEVVVGRVALKRVGPRRERIVGKTRIRHS